MAEIVGVREHADSKLGGVCDRQDPGGTGIPCSNPATHKMRLVDGGLQFDVNACTPCVLEIVEKDRDSVLRCERLT